MSSRSGGTAAEVRYLDQRAVDRGCTAAPCQIWVLPGIPGWYRSSPTAGATALSRTNAGTGGRARTAPRGVTVPPCPSPNETFFVNSLVQTAVCSSPKQSRLVASGVVRAEERSAEVRQCSCASAITLLVSLTDANLPPRNSRMNPNLARCRLAPPIDCS